MRRLVTLASIAAALALPVVAGAEVPNLSWTSLLPASASPKGDAPTAPGCRQPSVRCVDREIRRMERLQRRLGCSHRGVFATTYLELTRVLRRTVRRNPRFFRYPKALYAEDALFAELYFRVVRTERRGGRVPPAWRVAFRVARRGEVGAITDVLLGINAHVQRDMPFVLARLGLRTPAGRSRKVDHDRFSEVLNRSYERVIHAVADRFDPSVETTNSDATPIDDLFGLELVRTWREGVWRNAERLVNARSRAQRARVAESIEVNAALTAKTIASAGHRPGYRPVRDAYCRRRLGRRA